MQYFPIINIMLNSIESSKYLYFDYLNTLIISKKERLPIKAASLLFILI